MIHRIFSTDSRFKALRFQQGFNVVMAEKSAGARKDQTRNAAGKSSILELIHYVLGSNAGRDSTLAKEAFDGHVFGMAFDLNRSVVIANRPAGAEGSRNQVFFSDPVPEFVSKEVPSSMLPEERSLRVKEWTELLGRYGFGVAPSGKFSPTFRLAFPYFCRLDSEGGIHDPFETWKKQPAWQRDVTIAFLLGLDWHVLSQMESLRVEESHLDQLKRELKGSGVVGQLIGETSGLRAKLAIADQRVRTLEQQVDEFQVLPEYREVEREASQLARSIADLSDRNTADRRLIVDLESTLIAEKEPAVADLERLYLAAGIQLPGLTLQRIESAKEFHRTVIRNRRAHLEAEIGGAKRRIQEREADATIQSRRHKELMGLLRTHGALDQLNKIHEELSRLRSSRDLLQRQFELAQKIEKGGADLELKRATLHRSLVRDTDERAERLNETALLYAELSKDVSERSSILELEPTSKGLRMAITGGPDKSKGIREQQIFCFDMLLTVMQSKRPQSLGFLVHDSHLFDAMDERQVANAIEVGVRLSEQHGFQYIITMNSDRVPYAEFSEGFEFDSYVIEPRLTDETETGGLFGFRF